ncbi:MAG: ribonuclease H-like domain-containing protein [Chloroflexi bacterium]|nr:ribonuclease H-like domain-containing protein [Chloroflexota bacterium]
MYLGYIEEKVPIETAVPGDFIDTPLGRCFVCRRQADPSPKDNPADLLDLPASIFASLGRDHRLAQLDFSQACFIDIETTGLGVDTGTLVFMVGLGYFEGTRFEVKQFFLSDPDDEPAMLYLLAQELSRFSGVVSFNGRYFDLPLLNARFDRLEFPWTLSALPHLDLLGPARRLWKNRLPSCSLSSLERNILQLARAEDVPGSLVPEIYFQYLDSGDARPLHPVFVHNLQDIITLPTLATRIGLAFHQPLDGGVTEGLDFYSLGRCYEDQGLREKGVEMYQRALASSLPERWHLETLQRLSSLYKRTRRIDDAVRIWEGMLDGQGCSLLFPYVELAKYLEHQGRDLARAEILVLEAMTRLVDDSQSQSTAAGLARRLQRIQEKMTRG